MVGGGFDKEIEWMNVIHIAKRRLKVLLFNLVNMCSRPEDSLNVFKRLQSLQGF